MGNPIVDQTVFLTLVRTTGERSRARILIDSVRSFGGALSHCPIWLFEADPQKVPCSSFESMGVQILPLGVPDTVRHYYYADKVTACARAEDLAATGVRSLIFLAPENLIIKPPLLFDLGRSFDVAVRPVHIKNVGLLASEPLDDFWRNVYETVGVRDIQTTVESFVDGQPIRAYFNSAAFAANPSKGLFLRWFECFEALVNNREYQLSCCQDARHQIFLHQAILSTLIATTCDPKRVHTLPPDYVYPYNLHQSVPPERRAQVLDDLVCVYCEDRSIDPNAMDDIEIDEPLRSWLAAQANTDTS
jgi:hypothetical protein